LNQISNLDIKSEDIHLALDQKILNLSKKTAIFEDLVKDFDYEYQKFLGPRLSKNIEAST
jgi:hypothetical protein